MDVAALEALAAEAYAIPLSIWTPEIEARACALLDAKRITKAIVDRGVHEAVRALREAHPDQRYVGYDACGCEACRWRRAAISLRDAWRDVRRREHPRNIRGKMHLHKTGCPVCGEPVAGKRRRWHSGRDGEPDCLARFFAATRSGHAFAHVVDRDGLWCRACHVQDADGWDVDHIVPLADGGSPWPENFQLLCRACHKAKTAREASERARRRRETKNAP